MEKKEFYRSFQFSKSKLYFALILAGGFGGEMKNENEMKVESGKTNCENVN